MSLRRQLCLSYSHTDAFAQIAMLDAGYLAAFKRKHDVGLFFSSQDDGKGHTLYGITAYHEDTQAARDEVEWLANAITI